MKFPWNSHSGFKLDLAASLTGSAWSMLVQLACVPLYIRFLGVEAYGLIGFYLMLQAMLQVLDMGLSPTMNREMARYSVQPEKANEARDLVRTLELGYWLIGLMIGLVLVTVSPWLAAHWIKASAIPLSSVRHALMLMAILAALQWPVSFYQGGLLGLRKLVLFNVFRSIATTVSNGGAVLILWLVSPTIQAFFVWLVVTNAVIVVCWTLFLWKSLPAASRPPEFRLALLRSIFRFAAGMSGMTAAALILTQSDKVILSSVLSLKVFGFYTLGGMFGTGLSMIITSVFNTAYPRFSALVAQGDEQALIKLYHRSTQMMAVLILPLAAVLALFSTDILQLWTRNSEVAQGAGPIATLLVVGSALNGLMFLPYALQLAYGWTSIGLRITIGLTIIFVPAIWIMARNYGVLGAASMWPAFNCVYMAIGVPLTHRRLLKGQALRWLGDVGLPFVAALFVALIGRRLAVASMSQPVQIGVIFGLFVCAAGAAVLVSSSIRSWLISQLLRVALHAKRIGATKTCL
ncbi:MAG: oligosaccharide flippase family protein [Terracidiphilus sp.]